jgi:hypothetical protein
MPRTRKAAPSAEPQTSTATKPATKQDAVRLALEAGVSSPTQIARSVKDHFGMEMTADHASTAKGNLLVVCLLLLVVYLVVCLLLLSGTETLNRLSSRVWAVMVCSLAALATLLELLLGLAVVWAVRKTAGGGSEVVRIVLAIGLIQGAFILIFLVASVKGFAALARPAVWHGFPLNRETSTWPARSSA